MKKTKEQLVKAWMKKNNICGENPWWDRANTYYNVTTKQLISLSKYIENNYTD